MQAPQSRTVWIMQFAFKLKYVQKRQLLLYGLIEIHIAWFWLSDTKLSVSLLFFFILKSCKVYWNSDYRHYLMCGWKEVSSGKEVLFPCVPILWAVWLSKHRPVSQQRNSPFFSLHNLYGNDVGREHGKNMEKEKGEIHCLHTLQWSFSYKKELLLSTRGSLSFFYGEA